MPSLEEFQFGGEQLVTAWQIFCSLFALCFFYFLQSESFFAPAICDEFLLYYNVIGSYLKTPYYAVVKEYFRNYM
ncbi:hypothetical protein BAZ10_04530 [Elizabethkingia occulta]|uniref:Uncharacterized protein n=1 Tax=Elizabethkingia occulta TaxID=1867263 RepID=A0A1T3MLB5_9FLAO|nr:hypothetical protein BB020_10385 [Elizabethkingia occulta]OPC65296.1 hypothetical protein BAZ10_04530 [Elizabethkingia occulta]